MGGISLEEYSSLVRLTYAAGLDRAKWAQFLASISVVVGGGSLALHSHDLAENANVGFLTHNYSEEHHASYRAYYASKNPWNNRVGGMVVGKAIRSQSVLSPEELRKTEFYNDWIRPQDDIGTGAGITVYRDKTRFLRLSANIRFRDIDAMQEPLVWLLDALGPHMSASFDLARRLAGSRIGPHYQAAIEGVPEAVFLIDHRGKVCLFNSRAEALLRDAQYLRLDQDERLVFWDRVADAAAENALGAILSGHLAASGKILVRGTGPRLPLHGMVSPFVGDDLIAAAPLRVVVDDLPAAILTLWEPRREEGGRFARLVEWYGLTPAELALADHLFNAGSVRSFAESRGVSIHTARNQVRSVLAKTGVSRQTALFALMAQLISGHNVRS